MTRPPSKPPIDTCETFQSDTPLPFEGEIKEGWGLVSLFDLKVVRCQTTRWRHRKCSDDGEWGRWMPLPVELYSTKLKALRAFKFIQEKIFEEHLRDIDALIKEEETRHEA